MEKDLYAGVDPRFWKGGSDPHVFDANSPLGGGEGGGSGDPPTEKYFKTKLYMKWCIRTPLSYRSAPAM